MDFWGAFQNPEKVRIFVRLFTALYGQNTAFVRVDFSGTYQVRTRYVLVRTWYVPQKILHNPFKIGFGGYETLPKLVEVEVVLDFSGSWMEIMIRTMLTLHQITC